MKVTSAIVVLLGVFVVFRFTGAHATSEYVQRAESAAKEVEQAGLCGTYQATGEKAFVESLNFKSPQKVVVSVYGFEDECPFFVRDGKLNIRADKAIFVFEIGEEDLTGLDEWTKGSTLKRTSNCAPMRGDSANIEEISHELCYVDGVDLQSQGMLEPAMEQYLKCCKNGSALSCNKYGLLQGFLGGNATEATKYFKMACDQGYGGGCSNLAGIETRKGNHEKAISLHKEACAKGFRESCPKSDPDLYEILK